MLIICTLRFVWKNFTQYISLLPDESGPTCSRERSVYVFWRKGKKWFEVALCCVCGGGVSWLHPKHPRTTAQQQTALFACFQNQNQALLKWITWKALTVGHTKHKAPKQSFEFHHETRAEVDRIRTFRRSLRGQQGDVSHRKCWKFLILQVGPALVEYA